MNNIFRKKTTALLRACVVHIKYVIERW